VIAKIRERLSVSKQVMQKFDMAKFSLKLYDLESKEQFQLESQTGL
jgi:hypothetical protein